MQSSSKRELTVRSWKLQGSGQKNIFNASRDVWKEAKRLPGSAGRENQISPTRFLIALIIISLYSASACLSKHIVA